MRLSSLTTSQRRSHLAEQLGLPTQHAQVGQAVAAVRDAHDQVAEHSARIMGRTSASSGRHPRRQCRRPTQPVGELGQAALPAWLAIPAPSVVTMSVLRRLVGFTFRVLSSGGCWDV